MSSSWLNNGKVSFVVVEHANKKCLVCLRDVGSHQVHYVEDLQTGKRVINPGPASLESNELDLIVKNLIETL